MASWENIDFSPLANLGKTYKAAQSERTLAELGQGLADGSLDYKQAAGAAAGAGRLDLGLQFLKLHQDQTDQSDFARLNAHIFGGGPASGALAAPQPGQPSSQPSMPPTAQPFRPQGTVSPGMLPGGAVDGIAVPPRPQIVGNSRIVGDNEPGAPYEGAPPSPAPAAPAPPQAPSLVRPVASPATGKLDQILALISHRGVKPNQIEGLKIAAQKELDNAKVPDEVKKMYAFQLERAAAGQPYKTMFDLEKELKQAGAQAITVDQRGENAEARAIGEGAGKRASTTVEAAGRAANTLQTLSRMSAMLGQVQQGKIEPARQNISAWAKSLGLPDGTAERLGLDPAGVGTAQAIQSLSNEMAMGRIGAGGMPANNFSDADRNFLTKTVPQLANDPKGNKIIVESANRMAHLDIQKGKEWLEFRRNPSNKGRGYDDFEVEWTDKISKQDLFGDLRKQADAIVGSVQPVPAPGGVVDYRTYFGRK